VQFCAIWEGHCFTCHLFFPLTYHQVIMELHSVPCSAASGMADFLGQPISIASSLDQQWHGRHHSWHCFVLLRQPWNFLWSWSSAVSSLFFTVLYFFFLTVQICGFSFLHLSFGTCCDTKLFWEASSKLTVNSISPSSQHDTYVLRKCQSWMVRLIPNHTVCSRPKRIAVFFSRILTFHFLYKRSCSYLCCLFLIPHTWESWSNEHAQL